MNEANNKGYLYVGVDPHKYLHIAVALNERNKIVGDISIENKPSDFVKFLKHFQTFAGDSTPVFGLEDIGGNGRSLAKFLVEQGQVVKEVNAADASIFRKRAQYKKNDHYDASCVAKVLLLDLDTLKDANPEDLHWTLRQLVGRRDILVENKMKNRHTLHDNLKHHYPSYNKFFSDIFGQAALFFWETYPSPMHLDNVTVEELAENFCKASRNSVSTKKATLIKELVESDGDTTREYQEERDFIVRSKVRETHFLIQELKEVERVIKSTMEKLGYKLDTMPGINTVLASKLVAEVGDIKRFKSPDRLAKFAGIAPYENSSGGRENNRKSKQGNRVLHKAFYNLAVQQVQVSKRGDGRNPVFREYYLKKQSEGKTKGQALVCVMRRLVNIIFGMMRTKTEYRAPVPKQTSQQPVLQEVHAA